MSEKIQKLGGALTVYDADKKEWNQVGEIEVDFNESENEKAPVYRGRVIVNNRVYRVGLWERKQ